MPYPVTTPFCYSTNYFLRQFYFQTTFYEFGTFCFSLLVLFPVYGIITLNARRNLFKYFRVSIFSKGWSQQR